MPDYYDKYYNSQPPVVKIIIAAGLGLSGYAIYRYFKNKADESQANQSAELATTELQNLAAKGIRPTYSQSQYENFSQQLVEAMNGCGTDEDTIYQVFGSLRNDADVLMLIKQFGVRYYQPCAVSSPLSYAIWQFNDKAYGGGLITWLGYDLDSDNIADINAILQGHGIKYTF